MLLVPLCFNAFKNSAAVAWRGACKTHSKSKMELYAKIVNDFQPVTVFANVKC